MGNLMNMVSKGYNNIMASLGVKQADKASAAEQQKTPKQPKPVSAHSIEKGESREAAIVKQGTAQISLPKSDEAQVNAWIQASKSGHSIDLGDMGRSERAPVFALQDHIMSTFGKDSIETKNAFAFIRGVENAEGPDAIGHMADRLRDKGITEEQVEMLTNGDFDPSAYVSAVENGQPVA